MNYTDDELLLMIRAEKENSLGYDDVNISSDLQVERSRALEYYKGDVTRDLKTLKGRSSVVSYDVADGIEQALPDIMEIFLREDFVSLDPKGPNDVEAAAQETEILKHVLFDMNPGEAILATMIKDALMQKVGIGYVYWEPAAEPESEDFKDQSWADVVNAQTTLPKDGSTELVNLVIYGPDKKKLDIPQQFQVQFMQGLVSGQVPSDKLSFSYTLQEKQGEGQVCIKAWTPNDAAVSNDTMIFGQGTYCGLRSRMRRQEALEDGFDYDKIMELNNEDIPRTEVELARDHVGENDFNMSDSAFNNMLDHVTIYYHWIRIYNETKKQTELWYVVTGGDAEQVLLSKEQVDYCPVSSITPFPNPHRFYGDSLADKLIPFQKIKTSIQRAQADSIHFTQNQRHTVVEAGLNEHTWSDLLNNVPGWPVRVAVQGAVAPLTTASLNFDAAGVLEYYSAQSELATGVMRSGGGQDPDSLHDTATGSALQMSAGQRRLRYMARQIAYGLKDLVLHIHRTYRENASSVVNFNLKDGRQIPVSPANWINRKDMEVEVGTNGGQQQEVANFMNVIQLQQQAVQGQGGLDGPLVKTQNLLEAVHSLMSASGIKNPNKYFTDPTTAPPPQPAPQDPSQAPEALKLQAELQAKQQIETAKLQADQQYKMAQLQAQQQNDQQNFQLEAIKAEAELRLKREQMLFEQQLGRETLQVTMDTADGQLMVKQKQLDLEAHLKEQGQYLDTQLQLLSIHHDDENAKLSMLADQENTQHATLVKASMPRVELGGDQV